MILSRNGLAIKAPALGPASVQVMPRLELGKLTCRGRHFRNTTKKSTNERT